MRIAVIGNCQARPVGQFLSSMCPGIELSPATIVHLSGPATEAADQTRLDQADILLAQSVQDGYHAGHLTTRRLRERYGSKVVVWPNLFFNGNCADLAYLTAANGERLQGPLGAYHNYLVFECWKNGIPESEAEDAVTGLYEQRSQQLQSSVQDSLEELRLRDGSSDVAIVEHIATQWQNNRLFFTFNHPSAELLVELSRQLADAALLDRQCDVDAATQKEPLDSIVPATNEHIARILALSYPTDANSKGVAISIEQNEISSGDSELYTFAQLISKSYAAYQAQQSAQLEVRITPSYSAA